MKPQAFKTVRKLAVTLLELLVVVLIIGILATIATGVYTGQVERARVAATQSFIRELEVAITRYEVDLGTFPPSGSANVPGAATRVNGSGLLHLALTSSMSGNGYQPASTLWKGPYINVKAEQIAAPSAAAAANIGQYNYLDSWGNPLLYVESSFYPVSNASFFGGTELFPGTLPAGANPELPAPNPYLAQGETYYNPSSYQIISFGPNSATLAVPFHGTEDDDVTNFGF